jgi:hypothetical protein
MTSAGDILNAIEQSNGTLQAIETGITALSNTATAIHQDSNGILAQATATNTKLDTLNVDLENLQALAQTTNELLKYITQQNETVICVLEKISRSTCGIWNETHLQTDYQQQILQHIKEIGSMYATANPGAALDLSRQLELQAEIERCCPPPAVKPVCTYEPCPSPPPLKGNGSQAQL